MNIENFFTETDYESLTLNSSITKRYPLVVKDNIFDEKISNLCYDELQQLQLHTTLLQPSSMGSRDHNWHNTIFRGDHTCWITPSLCNERNMKGVQTVIKGMMRICSKLREYSLEPLALRDFSVQFAVYPGNNTGYTRHLDATKVNNCGINRRQITLIYYVHKEVHGGQLRVFSPNGMEPPYLDVDANTSRLVIFQSEVLEHEVLPTQSIRMALTMWASGAGRFGPYQSVRPIRSTLSTSLHPDSLDRDHEVRIRWDERIPTHVSDARNDSSTFMINSSNSPDYHEESIFISIASFRDSELKYTLRDIFLQAQYPTRIFVGIILQIYDTDEDQELYGYDQIYSSTFFPSSCHYNDDILSILQTNIRVLRINAEDSRGPCWARSSAQSLWKDEKYYLQIDSHMRFRKYYDSYLIHIYKQCEEEILSSNSPLRFHFPVISTYPLDYSLDETCSLSDIRSTILIPSHFDSNGILRQKARLLQRIPSHPVMTYLWAAGFSFTISKVMMDLVPYDPNLEYLFFGEEISMAMRFFSHGGIFFSPPQSVVYHLWSRDHRPTSYPDTDEIKEIKKNKRIQSQQIILDMLKGINNETLISTKYGLGTIRSIHEYEQYLRVSFQQMIVDTTDPLYHESIFANNIFEVQETNNENGNKSNYQKNIEVFNIVQSFIT